MFRAKSCGGLLVAAVLAASVPGVVAAQDDAASPEGVDWDLAAYAVDGAMAAVPAGVTPTLLLADGQVSGSAGCNQFSGSYALDGTALSIGADIVVTRMACAPELQAVEDAYLALLPTTASWESADGMLQLLDADAAPILEYVEGAPDIAEVIALLEALQADVSDLRERVEALEASQASGGDGGSSDGGGSSSNNDGGGSGSSNDGGNGQTATKPAAPRAQGQVRTQFPDWMRDGLPPDQIDDLNREVVRWRDRADDEDGYRVYARRGFCQLKPGADPNQALDPDDFRLGRGKAVRIARLPADTTRYRPDHAAIDAALADAPDSPYSNDEFYDLFVSAYNDAGQSKRVKVASFFLTPEFNCP